MASSDIFVKVSAIITGALVFLSFLFVHNGRSILLFERNTRTLGVLASCRQTTFSDCSAVVNYTVDWTSEQLENNIFVPCPEPIKCGNLPIRLCYNRWQPDNVAYDDQFTSSQRWHLCSDFTYEGGRVFIKIGVGLASFLMLSWTPYLIMKLMSI